jgi:uncharacterized protein YoxC
VEEWLWLSMTIRVVGILAVIVLGVGMIVLARAIIRIMQTLHKLEAALDVIGRDARPVLDRARAIGENLNFIAMSVRKEVDRVGDTIAFANERLEDAIEAAEERVQELTALIDVVQGEVEDTVITATSTLRGIRTTAKLLRRQRNEPGDQDTKG